MKNIGYHVKGNLIDGVIYMSPNGCNKIKIYPHGKTVVHGIMNQAQIDTIDSMVQMAKNDLPEDATIFEVYEHMGWVPEE